MQYIYFENFVINDPEPEAVISDALNTFTTQKKVFYYFVSKKIKTHKKCV